MVGKMAVSSSREKVAGLIDSIKFAIDIPTKLENLRHLREEFSRADLPLLSEFVPAFLGLHTDRFGPVRRLVAEISGEIGLKYTDLLPQIIPVLITFLKDSTPPVARQAITSGTVLFRCILVKVAMQGLYSSVLDDSLGSSWEWMLKLKDKIYSIAYQESDGRRLLALKFIEATTLLYTPDPTGSSEPPDYQTYEGKFEEFNIAWLRGGHPILNVGDLSIEASQNLGLLLDQLRFPTVKSLSNLVIIVLINSLSAIAKKRPAFYGRILPVLLGLDPLSSAGKGSHAFGVHYALKNAFLSCLKCTHPGAAPWRDRLAGALRDLKAVGLSEEVLHQLIQSKGNMEQKDDSLIDQEEKPSTEACEALHINSVRKRSEIQDANDANRDDNASGKRARPTPNVTEGSTENLSRDDGTPSSGLSTSKRNEDNGPVRQLVAMFGALVAQGEKAAASLEILISSISADLLADVVMANMPHLPLTRPKIEGDEELLQSGSQTTMVDSAAQFNNLSSYLTDMFSLSGNGHKADSVLETASYDDEKANVEDEHPAVVMTDDDVAVSSGQDSASEHMLVPPIQPLSEDIPSVTDGGLSAPSEVPGIGDLEDGIPGLESAQSDGFPETTIPSSLVSTDVEDTSQEQGMSAGRSSVDLLPSVSTDRSEELSPKAAMADASSLSNFTEPSVRLSSQVVLPKMAAPVVNLDDEQKDCLQKLAFTRIIEAYKQIAVAGGSQIRFSLLSHLGVEFPLELDAWKLLQTHILTDYMNHEVIEILSHVNKRVKHQQHIGLPLEELWKLYMGANATPMVKNFCIVYLEMAFERVSKQVKENMATDLVANVSKLPPQHQEIILRITVNVLGECHSGQISDELAAKYRSISGSQDKEIFIEFCLHNLLYQPSSGAGSSPGLSASQTVRVAGKKPLTSDVLLRRKLGILNIVEVMELEPEQLYPLFVAACADSQEPVVKRGEVLLKQETSGVQLEDANLLSRLFLLFNGTTGVETVAPDFRVSPGNPTLRVKLMSIFCRSVKAANSFPSTLQCIFGCIYGNGTTARLKQLGMEFTVWVFKHAETNQLKLMGPVILTGILKSLDSHSTSESDGIAREAKTFAFQAIGLLAKRMPQLFWDKIDMAVRLFDALKLEAPSIRPVIQEATNSLAVAYRGAPRTVLNDLEALLLQNSQVEQIEVRFCAVRWATTVFDLQHCPSRFICMIGAADIKLDIREMALEGLLLGKDQRRTSSGNVNVKYPRFTEMLDYVLQQKPQLLEPTEMRESSLLFPSQTYLAIISFLLKCFEADVGLKDVDESTSEIWPSLEKMCLLLEHAMAYDGSVDLHASASRALIKVGSHFPEKIASRYAVKVSWLKQLLGHLDVDTRECVARLLGIASCSLSISAASDLLYELISTFSGSQKLRFEMQHGTLCALGYVGANCMSRNPTITDSLLQSTLKCLVDVTNSESATLASVAMQALGHIGLSTPLPLLVQDTSSAAILTVLHEKLRKLLSGDDIKAIQKIVLSLGHLCMKESSSSHTNIALDLIFSLCRSKVEDILFAAGEALSFLWGSVPVTADIILKSDYSSLSMSSNYLMGDISSAVAISAHKCLEQNEDCHVVVRETITRKLFDSLLYSNRKEERCAGTVWLLSLTMFCGQHPTIQQLLPEIQEAFSHLIGEQNELTQELASQGLSIVYELGDASMKKNLVDALVGTLTGSGKRKRAVKLAEDTEVFQEGTIGGSPSGGKLSTYKELCNLANEMGQPDLVYKFMDLANYQASLNSKRGAAFGFTKIAKLAGDALQPHLRLLVPRLFRYQYDPDKNVQDAMAHIWKSLVSDTKGTIDEHLDLIIEDLLVQCGSRLWRSREASCLALADIVQGRKFSQVEKHLRKIWTAAFRAMDDIKETVRIAGERLCRAVTSLTMRLCDVSLTEISDARKAMDIVLPLLLVEGIMSKVDNIRKASIAMVTKLAKGAGITIRPHLSDLVCCMLEGLSSLEDQGLNYVELHAANVGIQAEKLESLRVSIAKSSPLWDTLDLCIEAVDDQSLEQLVPRLSQLIRSGVGLSTRVGVASFISLLVQKVGVSIKPFTSMLLKLLFPVVKEEKSATSKRAFANSCAVLLKYVAPSQAQKLIEDTAALHAGDRDAQISCALLLKSYASTAADILSGYHATIIPVIFISRFDGDKNVSSLYEELWEENMGSEHVTLQLYLGEIVSLIREGIESSSWASKKKAAQATSKLCEVLGDAVSSYHHVLLTSLMNEIPGRIWEGKEDLLEALSSICTSCHKAISAADPARENAILSLVTSACRKKVKKYREAGFRCLEQILKAFSNPDFFNMVFPFLFEMCNLAINSKSSQVHSTTDLDGAETGQADDISVPHDKIVDCITSSIHVARLNDLFKQQKELIHVFSVSLSPGVAWSVKVSAFTSVNELCSKLHNILNDFDQSSIHVNISVLVTELFHSVSMKVVECIGTVKIAQVHIAASECLLQLTKLYKSLPEGSSTEVNFNFKNELLHQWEIERNEQAKSLMKSCIDILDNLEEKKDWYNLRHI